MRHRSRFLAIVIALFVFLFLPADLGSESIISDDPDPDIPAAYTGLEEQSTAFVLLDIQVADNVQAPEMTWWSCLVFQSLRDDNWEIYSAAGNGSNQQRRTQESASDIHPRFNPGCNRIVFSSKRTGNYDLYVMNEDGSQLQQLTFDPGDDVNPTWSPDSNRIAFQSYRDGKAAIYVMNADGSGQTRLTWEGDYNGEPAWSPDGAEIAFTSVRNGQVRVWLMNVDGTNQRQISNVPWSGRASWSPNGNQFAFDADSDQDGWQELWLMDRSGGNSRQVYRPAGTVDAISGSWSPDGKHIGYTQIAYVNHGGVWYWTQAVMYAWNVEENRSILISGQNRDWPPFWATRDPVAPNTFMEPLPAQMPADFTVQWQMKDNDTGMYGIWVEMQDGPNGVWTPWLTADMVSAEGQLPISKIFTGGVGGHTYSFRIRGIDQANNLEAWPTTADAWTTVESLPPQSVIEPLPRYSPGTSITLKWGGIDPGGSGITSYDVQVKKENEDWQDFLRNKPYTSANFTGNPGETYQFRVRARDKAQNEEAWPTGGGDTQTTFYRWAISGIVRDNVETPVGNATVSVQPEPLQPILSASDGTYTGYVGPAASAYNVAWSKEGYNPLPARQFNSGTDGTLQSTLPPADNLIIDSHFESSSLPPAWIVGGHLTPTLAGEDAAHTGDHGLLFGSPLFSQPLSLASGQDHASVRGFELDGNETLHFLWTEADNRDIRYASRSADGVWATSKTLTTRAANVYPVMAVQADGTVHVAWSDEMGLLYMQRATDGEWTAPQRISTIAGSDYWNIWLVVNSEGYPLILWSCVQNNSYGSCYSAQMPGGQWSATEFHENWNNNQLVLDDVGTAHLSFLKSDDSSNDNCHLYYVRRPQGGSWSTPQEIAGPLPCYTDAIKLLVNKQARGRLLWQVDKDVFYASQKADGSWTPARLALFEQSGQESEIATFQTALASNGTIYVVISRMWTDGRLSIYKWDGEDSWEDTGGGLAPNESSTFHLSTSQTGDVLLAWATESLLGAVKTPAHFYYMPLSSAGNANPRYVGPGTRLPNGLTLIGDLYVVGDSHGGIHFAWSETGNQIYYRSGNPSAVDTISILGQQVTIPPTMTYPVLSWMSSVQTVEGASDEMNLTVAIDDGLQLKTIYTGTQSTSDWRHNWLLLSAWRGKHITPTFSLTQRAGKWHTQVALDEVTLGSGHPDLWSALSCPDSALKSREVECVLTYGNRSPIPVQSAQITLTLPSELGFISADSVPTVQGKQLTWGIDSLTAESPNMPIAVRVQVSQSAKMLKRVDVSARIHGSEPEIEVDNNFAFVSVFLGTKIYLPSLHKN